MKRNAEHPDFADLWKFLDEHSKTIDTQKQALKVKDRKVKKKGAILK